MIGYVRQSESSTPTSVAEKDQVDYQLVSDYTSKVKHNEAYYSFYYIPNQLTLYEC